MYTMTVLRPSTIHYDTGYVLCECIVPCCLQCNNVGIVLNIMHRTFVTRFNPVMYDSVDTSFYPDTNEPRRL